jgi:hypothetical protein
VFFAFVLYIFPVLCDKCCNPCSTVFSRSTTEFDRHWDLALVVLLILAGPMIAAAGTLAGHVRDQNWYARRTTSDPFGVGQYEYAVNANGANVASLGGFDDTDVFGAFAMNNLPAGLYTVASWDVWWRSAYAFNVSVPASGTANADVRLNATMWGYPAFWDETGYYEFGQTFIATGPVAMIYLRDPRTVSFTRTLTVHENGPTGAQLGVTRTYGSGGDQRLIYGYNQMPTVAGRTYYVRIRTPSPSTGGVLMQMDPRPDFSDPMPGGWLYLGNGTTLTAHPDRDLGLVIMSDDDGIITDLYARASGPAITGATNVGQTFIARGVGLISAAVWVPDGAITYVVRVLQNGPGGAQVGTTKRGKPARPAADPEMIVAWAPGECPLTPGQTYFLEVTRDGGGVLGSVYANNSNPFAYGQAYRNGIAIVGTDLAGTLMEEQSAGSATRPVVKFASEPAITEAMRGSNELTIQWSTDVAANSTVEYAVESPPYTHMVSSTNLTTLHAVTLSNLQPHSLYHYRVSSSRDDYRPAVSRDFVICTRPASSNLLINPSFEEGTGASPRALGPPWIYSPGADVRASSGNHFFSLQPHIGNWFVQYSVNGSSSSNYLYQVVSNVVPGREYTFSAWVMTAMRENDTWKYDVWHADRRLIYMRLGIDPLGGANPTASSVQWTPRMYSHRHYTQLAKSVVAQSTNLSVFLSMHGEGGQWHLYGVDDCALTHESIAPRFVSATVSNGMFETKFTGRANRTNALESSLNTTNWTPVGTFFNRTGTSLFREFAITNRAQRFFRAQALP